MKRLIIAITVVAASSTANAGMYFKPGQLVDVVKDDQQEVMIVKETKAVSDKGITSFDALHKYSEQGKKEIFPDRKKPQRPDFVLTSYEAKCKSSMIRPVRAKMMTTSKDLAAGKLPVQKFQKVEPESPFGKLLEIACSPDFE